MTRDECLSSIGKRVVYDDIFPGHVAHEGTLVSVDEDVDYDPVVTVDFDGLGHRRCGSLDLTLIDGKDRS